MGRHPNNKVWEYFDYISDAVAQCQQCQATILTPNNKRQNMVRHLFDLHGINTYSSGMKVGLIRKPTSTNKRQRNPNKYIKKDTHSYILREENYKKTETCGKTNVETLNNEQNDSSEDDSILENNSITLKQDERVTDPLLNVLKIEKPVVKAISYRKGTQYNKNELENNTSGSALNDACSLPCNQVTTLEPSQLISEISVSKDYRNKEEMIKATALAEKLKAEARYFNELADLTRSKRLYVDLQCQQLRNQIGSSTAEPKIINSASKISTDSFFVIDENSPTSEHQKKI